MNMSEFMKEIQIEGAEATIINRKGMVNDIAVKWVFEIDKKSGLKGDVGLVCSDYDIQQGCFMKKLIEIKRSEINSMSA